MALRYGLVHCSMHLNNVQTSSTKGSILCSESDGSIYDGRLLFKNAGIQLRLGGSEGCFVYGGGGCSSSMLPGNILPLACGIDGGAIWFIGVDLFRRRLESMTL